MTTADIRKQLDRDRKEIAMALDETLEETIRQAWLPNTVAWIVVIAGGFALNLLLLIAVAGGGG